jgi:hypothetical protein
MSATDKHRLTRWAIARERLRVACDAIRGPMAEMTTASQTRSVFRIKQAAEKLVELWAELSAAWLDYEDEAEAVLQTGEQRMDDQAAGYRESRLAVETLSRELRTARIELDRWEALFRTVDPAAYETNVVMWSVLCGGAFGLGVLLTMWVMT